MDVDTHKCDSNSNQGSQLPDRLAVKATIQHQTPHQGPSHAFGIGDTVTPSPDNNGDMAPQPEVSVLPRTVSLSPTEQSDESETSKSLATPSEDEEEEDSSVRRSKREKKSTLVYIGGQAVLKENNYQMKGLSYQYGTDFETAPPKTDKKKATATKPKASKPRPVTQQEKKRLEHNAAVKKRIESKKERRTQFLASNLMTMEPFLEERVAAQLKLKAAPESSSNDEQELFLQPDAIQADMRDYQLEGLNWMVKMHESNLGMVLGDEMGLVSF